MSEMEYTYAVARIRALEVSLFSKGTIDQLMACKSYDQALSLIVEKGWGGTDVPREADAIMAEERNKIWATVRELGIPMKIFDVLSYPNVFHNLKTAIKEVYTDTRRDDFFYQGTIPSMEDIRDIVAKKEFYRLPKSMEAAAQEAYETIFHTGDGQLCDVIIDQACLKAIDEAGKDSGEDIIERYADIIVTVANIKIALRCEKTRKPLEFMQRAMVAGGRLDADRLAKAALTGFDAICDYLSTSGLSEAAEAIKVSPSAFECWCDNYLIDMIRSQKYEAFTIGPIVAYVLARENEIKTVGIVLSGKLNGLTEESIRERVREMYV